MSTLSDALSRPARTVDDVVAMMTHIDAALPDSDGVKWFNRLYLRVTVSVRRAVGDAQFADPPFLSELDVIFGNLYFVALAAGENDIRRAPAAWRPLFEMRRRQGIARLQFALAGMNAHINRDLPDGIVEAFRAMGGDPTTAAARRRDFDAVNDILERVEAEVKPDFSTGLVGDLDAAAGRLDDVAAMWKVREARAAAWTNAEVLWALADAPPLHDAFFDRLDGLAALAGRGLLLPLGAG